MGEVQEVPALPEALIAFLCSSERMSWGSLGALFSALGNTNLSIFSSGVPAEETTGVSLQRIALLLLADAALALHTNFYQLILHTPLLGFVSVKFGLVALNRNGQFISLSAFNIAACTTLTLHCKGASGAEALTVQMGQS